MNKKFVVISAILAVVFDLIACIGDSNETVYSIFMGLCCAAFCVYVYGLFRMGYNKKILGNRDKIKGQLQESCLI